ncbi:MULTISPECIES: hypothetical protein [unclassified Streptomyces]|uniref:hypothetical protein n=1 Tax=unclassified Streptomyces TaxID=2593676 RepID=UPI002E0DC5D0|nr:hypothetical protein OG279_38720 [Streptomyces sp. NBC_01201]
MDPRADCGLQRLAQLVVARARLEGAVDECAGAPGRDLVAVAEAAGVTGIGCGAWLVLQGLASVTLTGVLMVTLPFVGFAMAVTAIGGAISRARSAVTKNIYEARSPTAPRFTTTATRAACSSPAPATTSDPAPRVVLEPRPHGRESSTTQAARTSRSDHSSTVDTGEITPIGDHQLEFTATARPLLLPGLTAACRTARRGNRAIPIP